MTAAAQPPEESPPTHGGAAAKNVSFDVEFDSAVNPQHGESSHDVPDVTAGLSDEIMLRIFSNLPSALHISASLVCKKWLRLLGHLRHSLILLEWSFLDRLVARFPDLTDIDLVPASMSHPPLESGILLSVRNGVSFHLDPEDFPMNLISESRFLPSETIDRGLEIISESYPSLRKLSLISNSSHGGLTKVAASCLTLLELELHWCKDSDLVSLSAFGNLQILKIIGAGITDIGLTILAHGCKRLVKLDLSGCEGSYDGISAIGRCCLMLEELTLSDHRMDGGWIAGLPFCGNLKTLRMIGCRCIDKDPGPIEHLGSCLTIERLDLERCHLRDKRSLNALFFVCDGAKEMIFKECWGLDDEIFSLATICRGVKLLSLEGCSVLRTEGLEKVILSWMELQSLRVVSCNGVKDGEITPAMADLFSMLKELKWRPDSRSALMESLAGTGMGKKGGRLFKWA